MSTSRSEMRPGGDRAPVPAASAAAPLAALARPRFPAIREAKDQTVFFDNAAGAQVPDEVI